MKNINLDDIVDIGDYCFYVCNKLSEIKLNKVKNIGNWWREINLENVENIGNTCFYRCLNLKTINLSSCITRIYDYTFNNCSELEYINLDGVVELDRCCFRNCNKLENINLKNIKQIGYKCFENCINLKNIGTDLKYIMFGGHCFENW